MEGDGWSTAQLTNNSKTIKINCKEGVKRQKKPEDKGVFSEIMSPSNMRGYVKLQETPKVSLPWLPKHKLNKTTVDILKWKGKDHEGSNPI